MPGMAPCLLSGELLAIFKHPSLTPLGQPSCSEQGGCSPPPPSAACSDQCALCTAQLAQPPDPAPHAWSGPLHLRFSIPFKSELWRL